MVLRIELSNFFSIRDLLSIDFRAANIHTRLAGELRDNVMEWSGMNVLKTIGLFGPNASGKSNIIKAIRFCWSLILHSIDSNVGTVFDFAPFKFNGYDNQPSSFLINFVIDGIEYEYSFTLTRTAILDEALYYYPKGRRARVFTRHGIQPPKYTFGEGLITRPLDVVTNTSDKNLFLTRASSMNREIAQRVYRYFLDDLLPGIQTSDVQSNTDNFNAYKPLILRALSICDTDIVDIKINKANGHFVTYHKENPSLPFDLLTEESDGTIKLFRILLNLLDVVKHGKTLLLDEFDSSLHIRLADFIIDLVHASKASQLLFTSHSTNLIDIHRFRKDQIAFVNKRSNASTEVYSLFDYKDFRDNMDAEKAYIQGRFDAVPYVESSVSGLKSLLKEK
ncbi:AAA family ATPase [Hallella absiana]|uniref:AAA family ATPase n=1 Tax=Hallella absiana TaxID=2925336 RepID=UPI0021C77468|nr:ATP-binding protein [Hallella absiana]